MVHFEGAPKPQMKVDVRPTRSPQEVMQQRAADAAKIAEFKRAQEAIAQGEVKSVEEFYAKQDAAAAEEPEIAVVRRVSPRLREAMVPAYDGAAIEGAFSAAVEAALKAPEAAVEAAQEKRQEQPGPVSYDEWKKKRDAESAAKWDRRATAMNEASAIASKLRGLEDPLIAHDSGKERVECAAKSGDEVFYTDPSSGWSGFVYVVKNNTFDGRVKVVRPTIPLRNFSDREAFVRKIQDLSRQSDVSFSEAGGVLTDIPYAEFNAAIAGNPAEQQKRAEYEDPSLTQSMTPVAAERQQSPVVQHLRGRYAA